MVDHCISGETGASCYNFQLKSLFVKSMLDELFLSTYTVNLLFKFYLLFIKFIIRVNKLYQTIDIPNCSSIVTTSPVYGASCYIIRGKLLHHTGHVVTSYGASCYIIRGMLLHHTGHVVTSYGACCYSKERVEIAKQVSLVHVTVVTLTGLYTHIHVICSVHNNVGVHSFIS